MEFCQMADATSHHNASEINVSSSLLVYILLLNWNGWKDTVSCVDSCQSLLGCNFRLLIVDNASSDGSEKILRQRFPDIELIQSGANLGFAGGNNVGIRHALERGADYIWLLNNDTVVDPSALSCLVETMERDHTIGMVGSKILYFGTPDTIWYAGADLDPRTPYRSCHRGLNQLDRGQFDEPGETGYVTGCSLLVRRKVVEMVGVLEENMFLYYEDTDWSARARHAGWKLFYAPSSVVFHKASASMGGTESPRMSYYLARNLLYFVRRNYPGTLLRTLWFDFFQNIAVMAKKGRWRAAGFACRGIFDFFRGRFGVLR
jgi:GT2 family glycosyltransferase